MAINKDIMKKIKRALISVSDKKDLKIYSSGFTKK